MSLCYDGCMTARDSIKAKFDEYEYIIKLLTAKAEELAAENERLRSVAGAHGVLKAIYGNPDEPTGHRIKAATAALPHETPKLMPERAPLDLVAEPQKLSLFDLAEARRKKTEAFQGRDIQVQPNGEVVFLPRPGERNGNGEDHS